MIDSYEREALELATILDTMADGVFVIDNAHVVQRWNHAMERLTGYTAEEAIGRCCMFLRKECAESTHARRHVLDCDLYADGIMDNRETFIRRKDGTEAPVMSSARVMRDERDEPLGAVVTLKDISSLKRLEGEVDRLRREVAGRHEFHHIVGKSRAMQEVFNLIELAAASPVTVLIQGETGTGKELVAKAIHYHSDRRTGPLVSVNCSALSESLLESELFGHVRGSFTGAVGDHVGRFERANQGTIFLDEVGDLPPAVQVKLLRVLQERHIERVGDRTTRPVDVRVIAATHRDLRQLVEQGRFREDLYYRLKVFPIVLPSLRERKEDIDLLVKRFISRFNEQTGKEILGLSPDAMRIVMDYCWPGNIRELENAVEHAFVTCPRGYIGPFDLPIEIRRVELRRQVVDPDAAANYHPTDQRLPSQEQVIEVLNTLRNLMGQSGGTPRTSPSSPAYVRRKAVSREELVDLLAECGWNKAEAARRLGVTRTTVWRRMKALGIPCSPEQ